MLKFLSVVLALTSGVAAAPCGTDDTSRSIAFAAQANQFDGTVEQLVISNPDGLTVKVVAGSSVNALTAAVVSKSSSSRAATPSVAWDAGTSTLQILLTPTDTTITSTSAAGSLSHNLFCALLPAATALVGREHNGGLALFGVTGAALLANAQGAFGTCSASSVVTITVPVASGSTSVSYHLTSSTATRVQLSHYETAAGAQIAASIAAGGGGSRRLRRRLDSAPVFTGSKQVTYDAIANKIKEHVLQLGGKAFQQNVSEAVADCVNITMQQIPNLMGDMNAKMADGASNAIGALGDLTKVISGAVKNVKSKPDSTGARVTGAEAAAAQGGNYADMEEAMKKVGEGVMEHLPSFGVSAGKPFNMSQLCKSPPGFSNVSDFSILMGDLAAGAGEAGAGMGKGSEFITEVVAGSLGKLKEVVTKTNEKYGEEKNGNMADAPSFEDFQNMAALGVMTGMGDAPSYNSKADEMPGITTALTRGCSTAFDKLKSDTTRTYAIPGFANVTATDVLTSSVGKMTQHTLRCGIRGDELDKAVGSIAKGGMAYAADTTGNFPASEVGEDLAALLVTKSMDGVKKFSAEAATRGGNFSRAVGNSGAELLKGCSESMATMPANRMSKGEAEAMTKTMVSSTVASASKNFPTGKMAGDMTQSIAGSMAVMSANIARCSSFDGQDDAAFNDKIFGPAVQSLMGSVAYLPAGVVSMSDMANFTKKLGGNMMTGTLNAAAGLAGSDTTHNTAITSKFANLSKMTSTMAEFATLGVNDIIKGPPAPRPRVCRSGDVTGVTCTDIPGCETVANACVPKTDTKRADIESNADTDKFKGMFTGCTEGMSASMGAAPPSFATSKIADAWSAVAEGSGKAATGSGMTEFMDKMGSNTTFENMASWSGEGLTTGMKSAFDGSFCTGIPDTDCEITTACVFDRTASTCGPKGAGSRRSDMKIESMPGFAKELSEGFALGASAEIKAPRGGGVPLTGRDMSSMMKTMMAGSSDAIGDKFAHVAGASDVLTSTLAKLNDGAAKGMNDAATFGWMNANDTVDAIAASSGQMMRNLMNQPPGMMSDEAMKNATAALSAAAADTYMSYADMPGLGGSENKQEKMKGFGRSLMNGITNGMLGMNSGNNGRAHINMSTSAAAYVTAAAGAVTGALGAGADCTANCGDNMENPAKFDDTIASFGTGLSQGAASLGSTGAIDLNTMNDFVKDSSGALMSGAAGFLTLNPGMANDLASGISAGASAGSLAYGGAMCTSFNKRAGCSTDPSCRFVQGSCVAKAGERKNLTAAEVSTFVTSAADGLYMGLGAMGGNFSDDQSLFTAVETGSNTFKDNAMAAGSFAGITADDLNSTLTAATTASGNLGRGAYYEGDTWGGHAFNATATMGASCTVWTTKTMCDTMPMACRFHDGNCVIKSGAKANMQNAANTMTEGLAGTGIDTTGTAAPTFSNPDTGSGFAGVTGCSGTNAQTCTSSTCKWNGPNSGSKSNTCTAKSSTGEGAGGGRAECTEGCMCHESRDKCNRAADCGWQEVDGMCI